MITLTADERRKFSLYLRQSASINAEMLKQLGKLSFGNEAMDKVLKRDIAASLIVADGLDSMEEVTIEGLKTQ